MKRDSGDCPLCGAEMGDVRGPTEKHLDHVIPLSAGGQHTRSNTRIICRTCNLTRPYDASDVGGRTLLGQT